MTGQSILRENLEEIYKVACEDWKTKLEGYAKRNLFQPRVELTDAEVEEMFAASNAEQKKVLNKYFEVKRKGIMGKVTSFETACEVLNISPKNKTAYEKLCIIIKALNEGWWPDFTNGNEDKFWNYWYMNNKVFSLSATSCRNTVMLVPSALYLKNRELAVYAAEIAYEEYKACYLDK